ncbi:peptide ABC transporter, permease protein [Citreicella sp. SE45]|uniref:Peptide/nickel transport system permease protein n=1 Tax=Salipiger thiooxidans TaxID=282683 RepID=A0A1G7FPJ3_9RHOB|nr:MULTISPECIES: ABC transporter permease [Salipiger]EEX11774.1 peptide ABC transporter, permease protein [Citreicella sp. SE45]NIY95396.1 ABC transporter permease [Salipiger sp. HF18]NVK61807.1 ABC transporter permease [Paracoccaceae bacterium]SDE77565.1 peptide/nickel transport system permease protein [Salipiger thiooxidans]
MLFYVARRLLTAFITILVVVILAGVLIHVVPGDPITAMLAQSGSADADDIARLTAQYGLDQPVWKQALLYAGNALQGDLGTTIRGGEPVAELLLDRLPNTIALAVAGLGTALVLGIPMGFIAAVNRGRAADFAVMLIAILGVSIPGFWMGLTFIQVFSLHLGWFPVAGTSARNIVLPALTLGVVHSALVARMTRSALVDILNEDYIRTARARGLREHQVLLVHAMRPAMISVVTVVGLVFAHLLGGQVITENVFSWNGIGRLAIQAMLQRDYPLVQGFIVIFATSIVLVTTALDLLYGLLDPRVRRR